MLDTVRNSFYVHIDNKLVDEFFDTYRDTKNNYILGGYRLNAVEAGRFCEAVLRILEFITTGSSTPINEHINTDTIISRLSNLSRNDYSDSIRLHIPRCVRVIYDIRNKRDIAHLADGIDPNIQDATLVISIVDWIMSEFIRLHHRVTPDEAHSIIQSIVTKKIPIIEEFD